MTNNKLFDISVLYVEDEGVARERLGAIIGRRVKDLRLAEDGAAGLELFKQAKADLVITDIRMPKMNGLAMARELKLVAPEVHIIVTTAFNDTDFLVDAIDVGIDQYLVKPVDSEKLFKAMSKCYEFIRLKNEVKRRDEEQKKTIDELRKVMTEIKVLRGFLPICSSCKKIRDNKGAWNQIESYIKEHSEAEFSHGICPECARILYPDIKLYNE